MLGDKILKVWRAAPCSLDSIAGPVVDLSGVKPGEVLGRIPGTGFAVAAAGGCIAVTEVQLQGSKRMRAEDFMHGHNIIKGTRLE